MTAPLGEKWKGMVMTDVGDRSAAAANLFGLGDDASRAAGFAIDSVTRLRHVMDSLGIPTTSSSSGEYRTRTFKTLGHVNFDNPKGALRSLALWGNTSTVTTRGAELSARSAPTVGSVASRTSWLGGGSLTALLPFSITSTISAQVPHIETQTTPRLATPAGFVAIASPLDDDVIGTTTARFGGGAQAGRMTQQLAEVKGEFDRLSMNGRHHFTLATDLVRTAYRIERPASEGAFTFASLDALASGLPASFTRLGASPDARSRTREMSASLTDYYGGISSRAYRLTASLRLDHLTYDALTPPDTLASRMFGGTSGRWTDVGLSPRLGILWTPVNRARAPFGTFRFEAGVYRGALSAASLTSVGASGRSYLQCTGTDVPTPDWRGYVEGTAVVPSACIRDGGESVDPTGKTFEVLSPSFTSEWSRKVSGSWTHRLPRLATLRLGSIRTEVLAQPSTIDLNLARQAAFSLASEADRPVYVAADAIDPLSGVSDIRRSRVVDGFSQVWQRRSDGRTTSNQFMAQLGPRLDPDRQAWLLSYTHTDSRSLGREGVVAGDPRALTRARGSYGNTHLFQARWSDIPTGFGSRLSLVGTLVSGTPFTPTVAGDVNGDGVSWNDAAFVFDPARVSDPRVAAGMRALLASPSEVTRRCLAAQLGSIARRNSCTGPWRSQLDLVWFIPVGQVPFRPSNAVIRISNVPGLADRLLHGERGRRGWGDARIPDPTLLTVRGFDASTRQFAYDVNPNFGGARRSASLYRTPFRVTIEFSREIARHPEDRELDHFLDEYTKNDTSEAALRRLAGPGFYGTSPFRNIVNQRDNFLLTAEQVETLGRLHTEFVAQHRAVLVPLALRLGTLDSKKDRAEVRRVFTQARLPTALRLQEDAAATLHRLLSADQWELTAHPVRDAFERWQKRDH
jgi:hypothetical protein